MRAKSSDAVLWKKYLIILGDSVNSTADCYQHC